MEESAQRRMHLRMYICIYVCMYLCMYVCNECQVFFVREGWSTLVFSLFL